MMVELAGGAPTRIASWQHFHFGVAADARAVYWLEGDLHEASGPGWAPTPFATPGVLAGLPAYLALDDTHVYFTTGAIDGSVRRVAR